MKELKIHVKINGDKIATAVNRLGFDDSASSTFEIIGILQNLIRIEQDKLQTQAQMKLPKDFGGDSTQVYDVKDIKNLKDMEKEDL